MSNFGLMPFCKCYQQQQPYIFIIFCQIEKILISIIFTNFEKSENSLLHSLKLPKFSPWPKKNCFPQKATSTSPAHWTSNFGFWTWVKKSFLASREGLQKKGNYNVPYCTCEKSKRFFNNKKLARKKKIFSSQKKNIQLAKKYIWEKKKRGGGPKNKNIFLFSQILDFRDLAKTQC